VYRKNPLFAGKIIKMQFKFSPGIQIDHGDCHGRIFPEEQNCFYFSSEQGSCTGEINFPAVLNNDKRPLLMK